VPLAIVDGDNGIRHHGQRREEGMDVLVEESGYAGYNFRRLLQWLSQFLSMIQEGNADFPRQTQAQVRTPSNLKLQLG
jgi:hypothetical protein